MYYLSFKPLFKAITLIDIDNCYCKNDSPTINELFIFFDSYLTLFCLVQIIRPKKCVSFFGKNKPPHISLKTLQPYRNSKAWKCSEIRAHGNLENIEYDSTFMTGVNVLI